MERKYNMAATSTIPAGRKSSILILGGTHRVSPGIDHYAFSSAIEPVTDFMLAKMRSMTPEEAAAAAAQAVAEAEAAIAAAEEAMREAEAAEADAKAAQAFVDAALMKLRERETHEMVPCLMESGTRDSQLERPSD